MIIRQMYVNNDKTTQPREHFIRFFFPNTSNEHFLRQNDLYKKEETFFVSLYLKIAQT